MKLNFFSKLSSTAQNLAKQHPFRHLSRPWYEVLRCNPLCSRSYCDRDYFSVDVVNQCHLFGDVHIREDLKIAGEVLEIFCNWNEGQLGCLSYFFWQSLQHCFHGHFQHCRIRLFLRYCSHKLKGCYRVHNGFFSRMSWWGRHKNKTFKPNGGGKRWVNLTSSLI